MPKNFLQTKQWCPKASTRPPQGHVWGWQTAAPNLIPTAMRVVSSSRCNPQFEIGIAWSQAPACSDWTPRNLAFWFLVMKEATRSDLFRRTTASSHIICLVEGTVGVSVVDVNVIQLLMFSAINGSGTLTAEGSICSWSPRVLTADAIKADVASETVVRIPTPPSLIGKQVCVHCFGVSWTLSTVSSPVRIKLSKVSSRQLSEYLFVLKICITLGTRMQFLNRVNAWWELESFSRSSNISSSQHLSSRIASSPLFEIIGDPSNWASWMSTIWNSAKMSNAEKSFGL